MESETEEFSSSCSDSDESQTEMCLSKLETLTNHMHQISLHISAFLRQESVRESARTVIIGLEKNLDEYHTLCQIQKSKSNPYFLIEPTALPPWPNFKKEEIYFVKGHNGIKSDYFCQLVFMREPQQDQNIQENANVLKNMRREENSSNIKNSIMLPFQRFRNNGNTSNNGNNNHNNENIQKEPNNSMDFGYSNHYKMHIELYKTDLNKISTNYILEKYERQFTETLISVLMEKGFIESIHGEEVRVKGVKPFQNKSVNNLYYSLETSQMRNLSLQNYQNYDSDITITIINCINELLEEMINILTKELPCKHCGKFYIYELKSHIFMPPTVFLTESKERLRFHEPCTFKFFKTTNIHFKGKESHQHQQQSQRAN